MRYTKLSFGNLLEEFNDPDLEEHWKFLALSEMGNILMEGGENKEKAETFFRELLDSDNPEYKLNALRYLAALEYMDEATYKKIKEFKKKSDNKEILQQVKDPI